MTDALDIPALRAVHEAATPGEWTANDLGQGQQIWAATYVGETRDYNANDALAITTYHNTYAALLDRAERCDELEGVLAAVEQGASNTIHLISAKLGELEAENARLRADNAQIADLLDCALDEYEGHNGRRKATPEYAHWSVSARAALKGGDDGRHD